MTSSQKSLILIYKLSTIVAILVIFIAYFGPGFKKLYKNIFIGHTHSHLPPSDIKFSEVDFIEGYIPGLVDPFFRKPLLACNLKTIDTNHIHWEGNWQAFNLNSETDFPEELSEEERSKFFGSVVYYPSDEGAAEVDYQDYMKENHPDVYNRLTAHKLSNEVKPTNEGNKNDMNENIENDVSSAYNERLSAEGAP